MTLKGQFAAVRKEWRVLSLYEKFEQGVVLLLTALMALVIAAAAWNLAVNVVS